MQNPEQYTTDEVVDMRKRILFLAQQRVDISLARDLDRAEVPATGTIRSMGTVTDTFEHLHAEQRDFEAQQVPVPTPHVAVAPVNNESYLSEAQQNVANAFANPTLEATPVQTTVPFDMYAQAVPFDLAKSQMEQNARGEVQQLASEPVSLDQMLIDAQRK